MPRPLVFGNRRLLVCLDDRHRIRDLYWPRVGQSNHISGRAVAWGVWTEGSMSWTDGPEWIIAQGRVEGSLAGKSVLQNDALGLRLEAAEAIDPVRPCLVRRVTVVNLEPRPRSLRFFFNHELLIDESEIGNTAMYHPDLGGIVHYRQKVYAFFGLRGPAGPATRWATGPRRVGHFPGTWVQCAQGELNGSSMDVGAVDSTLGLDLELDPLEETWLEWRLCMAEDLAAVENLAEWWNGIVFDAALTHQMDGESEWVSTNLAEKTDHLDEWQSERLRSSMLLIRTQVDAEGGILAGNDSDTMTGNTLNYSNVWPRDAALVADALRSVGIHQEVDDSLEFGIRTLPPNGLYRQKYWPDGTLGVSWHPMWWKGRKVLPIQVDETALMVWVASRRLMEPGAPQRLWPELVAPALRGLESQIDDQGWPLPSWDLWEERRGVSFFAVCSILAAWAESEQAARVVGADPEPIRARRLRLEEQCRARMLAADGAFVRQIDEDGHPDPTVDSALVAGLLLMPFDQMDDPAVRTTIQKVRDRIHEKSPSGGCARYEGDYYHRKDDRYPGSPWIISTLWLAQAALKFDRDIAEAERILGWIRRIEAPTGVLPESIHPVTAEPLSVSPLTWSHAELVRTLNMLAEVRASAEITSGRG